MSDPTRIAVVTLFPEMLSALKADGIIGRALKAGLWELLVFNPRDYANDNRGTVDDEPYGGGAGMVLMPGPLAAAIDAAKGALPAAQVTYLSPGGMKLNDPLVRSLAQEHEHILVCGRYSGIDERIVDSRIDRQISAGEFITSGGELPAMLMADALLRFVPGVVGDPQSLDQESFADGGLAAPCYTRPPKFEGAEVPQALLSGDHARIAAWRAEAAAQRSKAAKEQIV